MPLGIFGAWSAEHADHDIHERAAAACELALASSAPLRHLNVRAAHELHRR